MLDGGMSESRAARTRAKSMIGVSLSHSVRGRVIYSTVLVLFVHVEPYQHFVKQEAGPAAIVRRSDARS